MPRLGRPLAGNGQNMTVNLSNAGRHVSRPAQHGDMRFSKILRFGRTRSNVGIDLYNLFNANTGTTFNQAYGTRRSRVAAADRDPERAVPAVQRDGGLLTGAHGFQSADVVTEQSALVATVPKCFGACAFTVRALPHTMHVF